MKTMNRPTLLTVLCTTGLVAALLSPAMAAGDSPAPAQTPPAHAHPGDHAHEHGHGHGHAPAPDEVSSQPDAERRLYAGDIFLEGPEVDNVLEAIEHEERPEEDRQRDAAEKVDALLRAAGVERDMQVAVLRTGDGYLAQLLTFATAPSGKVWAVSDPASTDAVTAAAWEKRLSDPSTADIVDITAPLAAPLPVWARDLDLVLSVGAWHDAVARGIDRAAMHANLFTALRAGGRYVVIDSRAAQGSEAAAAASLCRSSEEQVRREAEAAGFTFVSTSDALREAADDVRASACDAAKAGKSVDRFLLIFEKAGG